MMEETHTILAVGAGAITKLVDYAPAEGGKPIIRRLFYPKYPYEYLRDESTEEKCAEIMASDGFQIGNIDVTVIAQKPKLAPYIQKMNQMKNILFLDLKLKD
jgi:2C-methyl-D-erythritol 2,4-cyclodiphosphate synthase